MRIIVAILSLVSVAILTACVDQNTADTKMTKGCVAAINALQEKQIQTVKNQKAETRDFQGEGNHRHLTLTVEEKDGWLELENTYKCVFLEERGPFNATHRAIIMQIAMDGKTFGKDNGVITGDWDDFVEISRVVDVAMGQ